MITNLYNNNDTFYLQNNITTNLKDNNHLCYLHNNMITDLNISIIFIIM